MARGLVRVLPMWRWGGRGRRTTAPGPTALVRRLSPRFQHCAQDHLQHLQAAGRQTSPGPRAHVQNWPISAQNPFSRFLLGRQNFLPVLLGSEGGTMKMALLGPFRCKLSECSATFYDVS